MKTLKRVLGQNSRTWTIITSKKIAAVFAAGFGLYSSQGLALRDYYFGGDDSGAQAIYTFDDATLNAAGAIADKSGVAPALNLTPNADGNLLPEKLLPTDPNPVPLRTNYSFGTSVFPEMGFITLNYKPNGDNMAPAYTKAQRHRTVLDSGVAASKLNTWTNGFSLQIRFRPQFAFQGDRIFKSNDIDSTPYSFLSQGHSGNLIVGLSNSSPTVVPTPNGNHISVQVPNFGVYQIGGAGEVGPSKILIRLRAKVKTTGVVFPLDFESAPSFISVDENENPSARNELIATYEPGKRLVSIYLNRVKTSYVINPAVVVSPLSTARLVLGNDLVPMNNVASLGNDGKKLVEELVKDQSNWSGSIYHLAIYTQGFSETEILGDNRLLNVEKNLSVKPDAFSAISPERMMARKMASRLTGMNIPVDHPDVIRMEGYIKAGDRIRAAQVITGDVGLGEKGHPGFLNTTVKNMALKMSNRDQTIRAPLNDFAATFIGVTRDQLNAKLLLTGDFYYAADPKMADVPQDFKKDIYETNNHYEALGDPKNGWDIGKVLQKRDGQKMVTNFTGTIESHPDPAGLLTSRAFLSEHAIAGTNRRLVEYTFKQFLCTEMNEAADTSASASRIGRDIDRRPGGDANKFETSCKGCHTVMDGMRGAFAKFDFAFDADTGIGVVRHADKHASHQYKDGQIPRVMASTDPYVFDDYIGSAADPNQDPDPTATVFNTPQSVSSGVVNKLNHNYRTSPEGYRLKDESFFNYAMGDKNKALFGWRGPQARGGIGVGQFGRMISDSKRFSQCLSKRVYEAVCLPREGYKYEEIKPLVNNYADAFESNGYSLRFLFQQYASNSRCIKP